MFVCRQYVLWLTRKICTVMISCTKYTLILCIAIFEVSKIAAHPSSFPGASTTVDNEMLSTTSWALCCVCVPKSYLGGGWGCEQAQGVGQSRSVKDGGRGCVGRVLVCVGWWCGQGWWSGRDCGSGGDVS